MNAMNKTRFFARFLRFLILPLLVLTGTFYQGRAQGFFTPTQHARETADTRFEILPDGYRVKPTFYHPLADVVYYFGDLHLNAAGEEIGWDSIELGTSFLGPFYTWLPDDDLLEYGAGLSGMDWKVRKLHLDGSEVWSNMLPNNFPQQQLNDFKQNAAGEVFVLGSEYNTLDAGGDHHLLLRKFGINGNLLWLLNTPLADSISVALTALPAQDGGCVYLAGQYFYNNDKIYTLNKVSDSGELLWSDTLIYPFFVNIQENSQGEIYTCGKSDTSQQVLLEKYAASGQLLWSKNITTLLQVVLLPVRLVVAENADLLLIGLEGNGQNAKTLFARLDPTGNLLWKRQYPLLGNEGAAQITGCASTPDNGFIVAGTLPPTYDRLFVLKIGANGNIYPGQISGQLALDANVNCQIDSAETGLPDWNVQLISPNYALYATTDSNGHYEMLDVPGDDYLLSAIQPSTLWESCPDSIPIAFPDTGSLTVVQDIPVQIVADCPFMVLDIGTPALRRCGNSYYIVHYCNLGTVTADSAYLQVVLDPFIHFTSASVPYIQNGDTVSFALGSVPSLDCGDFTFQFHVDCDSVVLGQTLCVSARIFPDTICNPPANWSGALLEGSGYCDGDSIRFRLQNIGIAPTSNGLNFIIADDHVIMMNQPLPTLQPDGVHNLAVPANNTTWRLLADQEPNAPGLEMPSVGVEGCGPGGPSWGFMLQFPNRDGNPFTDRDCHEVVGSFDPNDKQAFPIGFDSQHFIEKNTPLDYQIRFQNTGTDTAFLVIVKDTLSAWLDPATIRPGAASHAYTWTLSGAGILTFRFENIFLPDSNTNEAASHGFLQFSIDQRPENPLGALLENRAGIYFDFNAPVMTNTVWHTVGHKFLTSGTREPKAAVSLLQISPNPAGQVTTLWTDKAFQPGQQLVLRDVLGRVVQEVAVQGSAVELRRTGLSAGLYFLELREAGKVLSIGKLVWE